MTTPPTLRDRAIDAAKQAINTLGMWLPPAGREAAADAVLATLEPSKEQPGAHVYLSTGCLHGEHTYCQSTTGSNGAKSPATCKFCTAPCVCDCH